MTAKKKTAVYLITRFASQANRRNYHLLDLEGANRRIVLVRQAETGTFSWKHELTVRQWMRLTGVLGKIGFGKLEAALERLLFTPSSIVLYTKPVQRRLAREVAKDLDRGHRVCVINLLPPHELALIGQYIKRRFPEVRWIVDWQDLWSYDENYFAHRPPEVKRWIRETEREVLANCDVNVVTNRQAGDILERAYGVSPARIEAIPHAYEPQEYDRYRQLQNCHDRTLDRPVRIGFLGNLFKPPRVPGEETLRILAAVRDMGVDLTFHIIGDKHLEHTGRRAIAHLDWVAAKDRMSHEESLEEAASCDFLLLTLADLPNCQAILPMKLPSYFVLRKPILALVPEESASADAVRETGTGCVIPVGKDPVTRLVDILGEHESSINYAKRDEQAIVPYSWRNVSPQWNRLIDGQS